MGKFIMKFFRVFLRRYDRYLFSYREKDNENCKLQLLSRGTVLCIYGRLKHRYLKSLQSRVTSSCQKVGFATSIERTQLRVGRGTGGEFYNYCENSYSIEHLRSAVSAGCQNTSDTAQKMKFSIKDFFILCTV